MDFISALDDRLAASKAISTNAQRINLRVMPMDVGEPERIARLRRRGQEGRMMEFIGIVGGRGHPLVGS